MRVNICVNLFFILSKELSDLLRVKFVTELVNKFTKSYKFIVKIDGSFWLEDPSIDRVSEFILKNSKKSA